MKDLISWKGASVADVAALNPIGTSTLFASDVSIFFINVKRSLVNGPKVFLRNPSDCISFETSAIIHQLMSGL